MRICLVLDSFLPDSAGGSENYVLWLANELIRKGHQVAVVAASTGIQQEYKYQEIQVYRFQVPRIPDPRELNGLLPPGGLENFKWVINGIQPDIVHFHSFSRSINSAHLKLVSEMSIKTVFTNHLGGLSCIKGNYLLYNKINCDGEIKIHRCMTCHIHAKMNMDALSYSKGRTNRKIHAVLSLGISHCLAMVLNLLFLSPFRRFLPPSYSLVRFRKRELDTLSRFGDTLIALAPWYKNVLALNGVKKVALVKQGIPKYELQSVLNEFHQRKLQQPEKVVPLKTKKEPVKLIFVGRIHPMKGLHLLVDAIEDMACQGFVLTIIGIPNDRNYEIELKKRTSSNKNIEWKESLTHKEALSVISESDILVLPSISNEMAPLVILEAFALGKPVIGSDYPAIKDLVTDNVNGLIFSNNNSSSLLNCLLRFTKDDGLLKKLASGLPDVRDFESVSSDMENLYANLLFGDRQMI